MRFICCSIPLVMSLISTATVGAQEPALPDLRIRVRLTPSTGQSVAGILFNLTEDSVRLTVPDTGLPVGGVRQFEVSRGRRPNVGWGTLIGAGVGAVGGAAVGAILGGLAGEGGGAGEAAAILGGIGLGGGAVLGGITGLFVETEKWKRMPLDRFWDEGVRVRARTPALARPVTGTLGGIGSDGSVIVRTGRDVLVIPREQLAELSVETGSRPRFKWPTIVGSAIGLAGGTVLGATSENLEYAPAGLLMGAAAGALVGAVVRAPKWTVVSRDGPGEDLRVDQESTSSARTGPAAFCLQARPAARCRTFLVTEFGAFYRLDETYGQERSYLLTAGLGAMVNVGAQDAIGVTLDFNAHGAVQYPGEFYPDLGLGGSIRYRRWLGDTWRVDLSGGLPFPGVHRVLGEVRFPSAVVQVNASWRDLIGVAARWEPTFYRYRDVTLGDLPSSNPFGVVNRTEATVSLTEHAWFVGVEVGRLPGAVTALLGSGIIILGKVLNAGS